MNRQPDGGLPAYLAARKALVEEALAAVLPPAGTYPEVIFAAVRYSLFAGGKRLRPILCLAAAEAVGGEVRAVLPAACALEMIHTYSLIHDDLPAMDDDDYRRGQLTSHKAFGEGMAVLAGDALLTEAFALLSNRGRLPGSPPERLLDVANEIATAAGYLGMVGGQVLDILSEGKSVDLETLQAIHRRKTGALIRASLRVGAILSGATPEALAALTDYGERIGLAFQIADDILNVEGDRTLLGKGTGSDAARGKVTFPALLGLDASRLRAEQLILEALGALAAFDGRAEPLRGIARYVLARKT